MTKIEVGKEYNHTVYPMGSNSGYRKVVYVGNEIVLYVDYAGKERIVTLTTASEHWEEKKVKYKQVVYANLFSDRNRNGLIIPGEFKKNMSDVCDVRGFSTFIGVGTVTLEWEE